MRSYIHLATSLESGGAQRVLYSYLRSSRLSGKVEVFYLIRGSFYKERIKNIGVNVYSIFSYQFLLRIISNVLGGRKFTVVGWMYHASLLSSIFRLFGNASVIWSIHHGNIDASDSSSVKLAAFFCRKLSYRVPARIIYPSIYCQHSHENYGFSKSKGCVVYNPVDIGEVSVPSIRLPLTTIGFIGRNHPNKGYEDFLKAAIKMAQSEPSVKFVVCGKGTNSDDVRNLLVREEVLHSFELMGELIDVSAFYSAASVVTCLSKVESFGLVVVEALKHEKCVICIDKPVFRELALENIIFIPDSTESTVINAWHRFMDEETCFVHKYSSELDKFSSDVFASNIDRILRRKFCD